MITLSRSRVIAHPCQRAPQERAMIRDDDFLRAILCPLARHLAHNIVAGIILPLGIDEYKGTMIIEATPDAIKFLPLFGPNLPPFTSLPALFIGAFALCLAL